jgi:hypothetical protein
VFADDATCGEGAAGRGEESWRVRSGHDQADVPAAVVRRESRAATAGARRWGALVTGQSRMGKERLARVTAIQSMADTGARPRWAASPPTTMQRTANCSARRAAPRGGHAVAVRTQRLCDSPGLVLVCVAVQAGCGASDGSCSLWVRSRDLAFVNPTSLSHPTISFLQRPGHCRRETSRTSTT